MDFMVELPPCSNCTTVMTVCDRFSRMAHFIALSDTSTVAVAKSFFKHIVCRYGVPLSIVSDRDPRFTSKFW